jgi:hypothetical protein
MNGERFDELTRLVARLSDHKQSRRTLFRAAGAGGAMAAVGSSDTLAAPDRRSAIRAMNQAAAVDPQIDEIAFQLEYDVEKIFRFVTDEVKYQAYEGALRGPKGTLWSGAGNSVDQAQLLKVLLDAAMIPARFATGELAENDAADLMSSVSTDSSMPSLASDAMFTPTAPPPAAPAATPVVSDEQLATTGEQLATMQSELFETATNQVAGDVQLFTDLLTEAGLLATTPLAALPDSERLQHTWIRIQSGAEAIDLDPTFADAQQGDVKAVVTNEATGLLDAIPDDRFHTVRVQVKLDSRSGDQVTTQPIIDQLFRSQDLVGQNLVFTHIEPQSLQSIGFSLQELFEGTVGYYAILAADSSNIYLSDASLRFGAGGGVFNEVFGDEESSGPAEGETVAEYLEIEVSSPGRDPLRVSRTIFDRLAEQRASDSFDFAKVDPIEVTEIGDGEQGYLPIKNVYTFASVVSAIPEEFLAPKPVADVSLELYGGAVHALHAVRQRLNAALATPVGAYPDRPNFSGMAVVPIPNPSGGTPGIQISADLMAQGFGGDPAQQNAARITAGVAAQAAEEMFLNTAAMRMMYDLGILPAAPMSGLRSAGEVFRAARDTSIGLTVLKPGDTAAVESLDLGAVVAGRVLDHLANGRAVIVPDKPVTIDSTQTTAWWVYDPASGDFWDQLPDGRGGALVLYGPMAEYAIELWTFTKTVKGIFFLGACIFGLLQAVGALLTVTPSAGPIIGYIGASGAAALACGAYAAAGAI